VRIAIFLARFILKERWTTLQMIGLITATVAIVLIGLGIKKCQR
jgi:EamA domain-containing membrane protein RarD